MLPILIMPAPGPTPPPALMFPEAIRRNKKLGFKQEDKYARHRFYTRRTLRCQTFSWDLYGQCCGSARVRMRIRMQRFDDQKFTARKSPIF